MCRLGARGYDAAYSFGEYTGALRRLIHLLKYHGVKALKEPFGRWLAQSLPLDERVDLVVPVPLHWWRRYRRGFNQSEVLGQEIARRTGLLCSSQALRRTVSTPPQARMSARQRRRNVASAFTVPDSALVRGRTILLVDDVLTTGATLGACAKALKKAGARRVVALTLARVDRRAHVEPFPGRRAAAGGGRATR
jgi:ComF family protein